MFAADPAAMPLTQLIAQPHQSAPPPPSEPPDEESEEDEDESELDEDESELECVSTGNATFRVYFTPHFVQA